MPTVSEYASYGHNKASDYDWRCVSWGTRIAMDVKLCDASDLPRASTGDDPVWFDDLHEAGDGATADLIDDLVSGRLALPPNEPTCYVVKQAMESAQ